MSGANKSVARADVLESIAHLQLLAAGAQTKSQAETALRLASRLNSVLPLVEPGFPDVPEKLRTRLNPILRYSAPLKVLHDIDVDWQAKLFVVGDPDNGDYEWVLTDAELAVTKCSNVGYGQACIALRDGLIAHHGLPEARS